MARVLYSSARLARAGVMYGVRPPSLCAALGASRTSANSAYERRFLKGFILLTFALVTVFVLSLFTLYVVFDIICNTV